MPGECQKVNRVAALAMKRGKSVDFTGYWQRHVEAAAQDRLTALDRDEAWPSQRPYP
jgi:hypothetical protein